MYKFFCLNLKIHGFVFYFSFHEFDSRFDDLVSVYAEEQIVKTNGINILTRSLLLKKTKSEPVSKIAKGRMMPDSAKGKR